MHKDGKFSDNGRTRQKYCCPFKRSKGGCCPCNHKCWNNGKKNRGCTKYITIPDNYRLSIDRSSIAFKSVYASEQKPKDTIRALSRQAAKEFLSAAVISLKILIQLLISRFYRLQLPPLSLRKMFLIAV